MNLNFAFFVHPVVGFCCHIISLVLIPVAHFVIILILFDPFFDGSLIYNPLNNLFHISS